MVYYEWFTACLHQFDCKFRRIKLSEKFNCKALQKKGFTLAELMIVLAVLAVIAAVLMPTVFNSMPDENKLKFKKGITP